MPDEAQHKDKAMTKTKWTNATRRTLLAARVRLKDGTVGTIGQLDRNGGLILYVRGISRPIRPQDIAECGDDVAPRCHATCAQHGIPFVSMRSLTQPAAK